MAPSPQPSQLTRPSGDSFFSWPCGSLSNNPGDPRYSAQALTLVQAALDHLSQIVFLLVILISLLRSDEIDRLDFFHSRGTLFACAFVLSLRLLFPLAATLYTAVSGYRQPSSKSTLMAILTLSALVLALLVASFTLVASLFGLQGAGCILLLTVVVGSLALNTFVSIRLVMIQRRSRSQITSSSIRNNHQHGKGKLSDCDKQGHTYLPSTMSTAGTKASSANPYDARVKSVIGENEEPGNSATNESKEISGLWLDRSAPIKEFGNVTHSYVTNIDEGLLMTPPPSASHGSYDDAALSPPLDRLDRSGACLRISPSAREIIVSLSSLPNDYSPTPLLDLHFILIGLAGMWLVSILCSPLLVATAVLSQATLSSHIFSLCFIVGMAVTGPLIAFQAYHNEKHRSVPSLNMNSPLPRPSFASSLLTGRTSKASNYSLSHRESPIAGNLFEPCNGYDYPFSPYLPGSYEPGNVVKSVAYGQQHWTSGGIVGDRVVASQGMVGRAANMMSPRPRLQVLPPSKSSRESTIQGRNSSERFNEGDSTLRSEEEELQNISETSAVVPGAMPISLEQGVNQMSLGLQSRRRIDTIYEMDSLAASRDQTLSENDSPGFSRGVSGSSHFYRLTMALRKRRATLSEADCSSWVEVSSFATEQASICEGRQMNYSEDATVSSHDVRLHRGSQSMSVVQQQVDWFPSTSHEMTRIPDASCSDAEMGELSVSSFYSLPASDMEDTGETLPVFEDERKVDVEGLSGGAGLESSELDKSEAESNSHNWNLIIDSMVDSPPSSVRMLDMSLASSHSLAGIMGIAEEREQPDNKVNHSTPLRRKECMVKSTDLIRKSLCSEMGISATSPAQDSPCRTSSDISSLHNRRATVDTISESFLSSGVDEELVISPDATPERMVQTAEEQEREIVIVEMDESFSGLQSDPENSQMESYQEEVQNVSEMTYSYSTQRHQYEPVGNYLDPVEEVTEEPTLSISEHDSPSSQMEYSPVLRRNMAEEWARMHGFATPSSVAVSPVSQSRFGWAEVIETGRRTSQLSMRRRSRRSILSSPHSIMSSPRGRSRLDSDLSAHTKAYLATRLGTPSRLIGLHSKFWVNSPPSLALDAQAFLSMNSRKGPVSRGSLMLAMSPSSSEFEEESSWVDGALAEDEEPQAQKEMERCELQWRRRSRSTQIVESAIVHGSPVEVKRRTARQRSSASLQSLIDAAMKRMSHQNSRVVSSNRSSLASQMTLPSISITSEGGGDKRGSLGGQSDVKVVGSSAPSTPRRSRSSSAEESRSATSKAPSKSGGSHRSIREVKRLELESPSSGKGANKHSPRSSGSKRSPAAAAAAKGKRASMLIGARQDFKVHSRKESKVREKVKLLEYRQERYQSPAVKEAIATQILSPRRKVQPRIVVPGSPGKFRLQEASNGGKTVQDGGISIVKETSIYTDGDYIDKENVALQQEPPITRRSSSRSYRFNLRRPHPQIFVRPPSGSSTHTQHLY